MRPPTSSTANDIENSFIAMQNAIASSNKIVVVGGGPTGIEFAGEVISEHPTKQVTLIHKNASLLDERFPAKLGRNLISLLEKKGVKLVLGERLDGGDVVVGEQGGVKTYTTDKGTKVEGELRRFRKSFRGAHSLLMTTFQHSRLRIPRKGQHSQYPIDGGFGCSCVDRW